MIQLENGILINAVSADGQSEAILTERTKDNAASQTVANQTRTLRHVVIVTVSGGGGEGTRYDLWPLARAKWEAVGGSSAPVAVETRVEQDGVPLGTVTMLLEHPNDAVALQAYLAKRAKDLPVNEELLIVAHRPTEVAARSLRSANRVWTHKLIHMNSLPLYRAVRVFLEQENGESFQILCQKAKVQQPKWTEVAELDHDCGNKLHTLAFALQAWTEQDFDKDYRQEDGGPEKVFRFHATNLTEILPQVQRKIYGEEYRDDSSIQHAVYEVKDEAEKALHHTEDSNSQKAGLGESVIRMEQAWNTIQVLLPRNVETSSGVTLSAREKQLRELRLRALGNDLRGGLVGLLLGRDEEGNEVDIDDARERLQITDDYSTWYLAFRDSCEKLQDIMRSVEDRIKYVTSEATEGGTSSDKLGVLTQ